MNVHTPILKPYGCPACVDPRTWRQSVETRLNDLLDRAMSLITALDLMEADCDLEETADDEPSLGCRDDLEDDNSDYELGGDEETETWGAQYSQGADAYRRNPFTGDKP
jgi:hypothetical protein